MKNLLFLAGLMISALSYAQDKQQMQFEQNGFIGISIGPSIPLGDFGSTNLNNQKGGFADRGRSYNLNGAYFFHTNFGISANVFLQSWDSDVPYEKTRWSYHSSGFLLGGIATVPKGKFNFDFNLQLGYANSSRDQLTHPLHSFVDVMVPKATGEALAYSIGLGTRLHVGKGIDMMLAYSYFNSKPTLGKKWYSTDYDISVNNFTLGIGYRI